MGDTFNGFPTYERLETLLVKMIHVTISNLLKIVRINTTSVVLSKPNTHARIIHTYNTFYSIGLCHITISFINRIQGHLHKTDSDL